MCTHGGLFAFTVAVSSFFPALPRSFIDISLHWRRDQHILHTDDHQRVWLHPHQQSRYASFPYSVQYRLKHRASGLTVAPYFVSWLAVILQAWHSDKTHDRGLHVVFAAAVACAGYILLLSTVNKNVGAAYFSLFLIMGGLQSLFPVVM